MENAGKRKAYKEVDPFVEKVVLWTVDNYQLGSTAHTSGNSLTVTRYLLPVSHSGANVMKPPYSSDVEITTIQ
jgi:hypothetical protein